MSRCILAAAAAALIALPTLVSAQTTPRIDQRQANQGRRRITKAQNLQSKRIYRQKHDAQVAQLVR